jgi:Phage tail assembly chaperone protein
MIYIYQINGKIFAYSDFDDLDSIKNIYGNTYLYLESVEIVNIDEYKIVDGAFIKLPEQPGPYYFYDYDNNVWVDKFDYTTEAIEQRNKLLYESDWTQIPNNPLTPAIQQEWAVYRQALRDITTQSGYPKDVIWPTPPA